MIASGASQERIVASLMSLVIEIGDVRRHDVGVGQLRRLRTQQRNGNQGQMRQSGQVWWRPGQEGVDAAERRGDRVVRQGWRRRRGRVTYRSRDDTAIE